MEVEQILHEFRLTHHVLKNPFTGRSPQVTLEIVSQVSEKPHRSGKHQNAINQKATHPSTVQPKSKKNEKI